MANAWTNIGPEVRQSTGEWYGAAVCAVELPSLLPLLCVQPRRFPPVTRIRETPAGAGPFDDLFLVAGTPGPVSSAQLLTPDVRQRIMARDDWVFWAERYLLGRQPGPGTRARSRVGRCWASWPRSRPPCCPITWTTRGRPDRQGSQADRCRRA